MASFNILLVLLLAILLVEVTLAQNSFPGIPECAGKLLPCVDFFNSTNPPEKCCKPLRELVTNQKACLCNFFSDTANAGLIQSFGINVTQALELPKHCGVSSDTSLCSSAPAPAPGMIPPTSGMTPPPPGTTSGMTLVPGSAEKMAWAGASALLLFWVSLMSF
ncbi:hypothetical protein IFM89_034313 [Coptis chinensis]|uniref:Bifunctional inhibitor/plant lipid transfer protein/seed storage helical domain-containing protein n=1 Tax=Coptis chinensis TaxID=261450 RepID=A0A835IIR5_9MAGN|nr:hypothetical protein IFM89_034313 [Coptis chinensis]